MTSANTNASASAAYYNDPDVTEFYRLCWGGSDIHVGHYETGDETVGEASAAMTRRLLGLAGIGSGDRVLDIGCGYGGSLRLLAEMGCRAKGIDVSEVCVEEARRANESAGLADKITVELGDFHAIETPSGAWDAVICQESLIHSIDRPGVMSETYRVLRPDGVFAFSDILTGEGADLSLVQEAFSRLGAEAGATANDYVRMAIAAGFEIEHAEERPQDIATHYAKLAGMLARPIDGLDPDVADRIAGSMALWQKALAGGHITWACFIARRPEE